MTDSPFTDTTKEEFTLYLIDNPNSRRLTYGDYLDTMSWLSDITRRPQNQADHSRRHYIQKTFRLNAEGRLENRGTPRSHTGVDNWKTVVTTDEILDRIQYFHVENGHLGWDATWKDVGSSTYGILRSDVIFLLKRCSVCLLNPSKAPKKNT
jgi:hypothetical protein